MNQRRTLGLVFILIGLVGACIGIFSAVGELGSLYTNALEHPLDEPKGGGEKEVSKNMLWAVGTGVLGASAFLIGMRMVFPRRRRSRQPANLRNDPN